MEKSIKEYIHENFIHNQLEESESNSSKKLNIKTIIFDFGGVLFTDGSWAAIKRIKNTLYLNENQGKTLEECFSNDSGNLAQLIRLGLISLDEFLEIITDKLNVPKSKKKLIKHLWFSSYVPNYKMNKLLKKLSQKYRVIAFSGNVKERIKYLEKRYKFLKFFDKMIFSYDFHQSKRNLEFYRELLNHINCDPSEAILIDNSWGNIKRAKRVGLNGIFFTYTKLLIKSLEEFNIKL